VGVDKRQFIVGFGQDIILVGLNVFNVEGEILGGGASVGIEKTEAVVVFVWFGKYIFDRAGDKILGKNMVKFIFQIVIIGQID